LLLLPTVVSQTSDCCGQLTALLPMSGRESVSGLASIISQKKQQQLVQSAER